MCLAEVYDEAKHEKVCSRDSVSIVDVNNNQFIDVLQLNLLMGRYCVFKVRTPGTIRYLNF